MKYLVIVLICLVAACGPGIDQIKDSSSLKVKDMPVPNQSPNIFSEYRRSGDSLLSLTWVRKFDASGISFDSNRTCTLVTPQHVVMAAHFQRKVGAKVIFHDRDGKVIVRYITAKKKVLHDVVVGLLDEPVPENYKPYPLLKYREGLENDLKDEFVLVTDKARRVFVHQVRAASGLGISFYFDPDKKIGYGKKLVVGDSGNPSFVMVAGQPVLIETHFSGGSGSGPFYGNPEIQSALEKAISELGGTGSLRYLSWPSR